MDYSSSSSKGEACLFAMQLVTASVVPAVLKSAIELDLLELIKNAGPRAFVSPKELTTRIPTTNPKAPVMLDRIRRLLAVNNILDCRLRELPDGGVERMYSLVPVCEYLTRNDDGASLSPQLLMNRDKIFMETWYHLKDAVLEGGSPFKRAHGMSAFEYPAADPRLNDVFNQAMSQQSTLIMKRILEMYKGFGGLKSLVDVGGGIGASLNMVVSKYPSIKGINFDMPHVIQHAPSHPEVNIAIHAGIEHMSGDIFVKMPRGDAIFMKWICHDWSDAECLKILKNCYDAHPENGKMIIAECIIPEIPNKALSFSLDFTVDLIMLAFCPGGKETIEKEFQRLAKASGFREFRRVCCSFTIWIMEFYK